MFLLNAPPLLHLSKHKRSPSLSSAPAHNAHPTREVVSHLFLAWRGGCMRFIRLGRHTHTTVSRSLTIFLRTRLGTIHHTFAAYLLTGKELTSINSRI